MVTGKSKPKKLAEINISIYDDATVAGKFCVIHKYGDLGTHKEIMPKKEFVETMNAINPSVNVEGILTDLPNNSILAVVNY